MLKTPLPHWKQDSSHTKTIRAIVAAAIALMGVINGFIVLQPIKIGRLALLFWIIDQFAPFTPSLWPVAYIGRTIALLLGFFLCMVAFGLVHGNLPSSCFRYLLLHTLSKGLISKRQRSCSFCGFSFWEANLILEPRATPGGLRFSRHYPDHLPLYNKLGLRTLKIGEEALIYPQTFTLTGSAMANVRTSCRRAEREGADIFWYEGVPPEEVMKQLQQTSREWLEYKKGKYASEMGFSMGRVDELVDACKLAEEVVPSAVLQWDESVASVPRLVTGVATRANGQVCAFVTFTPIYGSHVAQQEHPCWGWALDLMRRTPNAPPGIIELLLVRAIERFRDRGAQVVSLGTVALADTRQEMTASQKQLANFALEHLRFLETHRSLFHFKQKFQPCWESRYLAVSTTFALPKIALALLLVHQS